VAPTVATGGRGRRRCHGIRVSRCMAGQGIGEGGFLQKDMGGEGVGGR
jgi:hypothetical protein